MSMFSQVSMIQKVILATAIIVVGVTLYINRDDIKNILTEVCYRTTDSYKYSGPSMEGTENTQPQEQQFAIKGTGKQLVLFYAPWCPHCKSMMANWDKFALENKSSVKAIKVNSDEQLDLVDAYSIPGFPTVLLLDANGKTIATYEGQGTTAAFTQFVESQ